ncbi:hypothetical protein CAPTEDRAFT_208392 [Capitella teleta]|uniref:Uncharacterized protein n=1 Tax=Capitella teleta TaxID=283909 RepID=R7T8J8_CAPTE|nr:hypothetical protein CAPTEDRAFT_208392 [Capitella teleta]|eukprot:ELT90004.1 hypothetical protein CAPTEDRAFT_208392 [Capitella teleta]
MQQTSGLMFSYMKKSEFHQNCIPKEVKEREAAVAASIPTGGAKVGDATFAKLDVVTQDTIWKQCVNVEKKGAQEWAKNWGFLTEFDEKGEPRPPKEEPEKVTQFSDILPNTNAGNYGSRLTTPVAQNIQDLEHRFNSQNRRRKLDNEMVCY